jgi:hypothetical protein
MVHHRHSNPSKNNELIKLILMKLIGLGTLVVDIVILVFYLGIYLFFQFVQRKLIITANSPI